MKEVKEMKERYLFISDFDKTLSVEDSGQLLSQKIGVSKENFENKVSQLRSKNIVKLGAELSYLILHDSNYKGKITRKILREVGREVVLKKNVSQLMRLLKTGFKGVHFFTYVVSAAPKEILIGALEKILPEDHLYGTLFDYGEKDIVVDVKQTGAGTAKVDAINFIRSKEKISQDKIVYVGDGLSDIHVMLHIKAYGGYPISVSPTPYLGHISKKTVVSNNVLSFLVPILEDIVRLSEEEIKDFFIEKLGVSIQEWNKAEVEWVVLSE